MHIVVNAENDDHPPNSNNPSETERCDMKSIYRNPYYDPVDDSECANLEKYLACIKSDIVKLVTEDAGKSKANLTKEEQQSIDYH